MRVILGVILTGVMALPAPGALVDSRTDTTPGGSTVDGTISANEYGAGNAYSYAGGGGGFGGTVGGGTLYMNSDATNLYIGFQPGNNLNDNAVIWLDTRAGGFFDADMNDVADPGRNLLSNATRDVNDAFPLAADFGVVIGGFGIVVFELNAGNSSGHLAFLQFDGTFSGNNPALAREIAIPLASLALTGGVASPVNFWAGYGSDTNFMSNESIPAQPFNAGGNPGFDNGGNELAWPDYDQFVTVPEPASALLLMAGGLLTLRRRLRR